MAENKFDFQALIEESKQTLINPKEYFKSMPKTGGFVAPIIKVVIYGLAAGVISFLLSIFHLGFLGGFMSGAVGIASLIVSPISALIAAFIGGVIILIISAICSGSTEYEACLRVAAAITVLYPINALIPIFFHISLVLEIFIGLCVSLYAIWMIYNAVMESLNGKEEVTRIVAIVLAALALISAIIQFTTYSAATFLKSSIQSNSTDAEKMLKEYMEKAQKDNQQKK